MADTSFFQSTNRTSQADINRRKKLAERLIKQGEQDGSTQMVSGYAVAKSPLEGLAKALQTGLGGYIEGKAAQDEQMKSDNAKQTMADAIGAYTRSQAGDTTQTPSGESITWDKMSPDKAGQMYANMLMQNEDTAPMGMQAMQNEMQNKARSAQEIEQFKAMMPLQIDLARQKAAIDAQYRPTASVGGATGELVDRLMKETGMPFDKALYAVQTGMRQGLTMGNNGTVSPMGGFAEAKGGIKAAESAGSEIGQRQGEAQGTLTFLEANMPKLEQTAQELSALGQNATYTTSGRALDATQKELGMSPRPAAVDRAAYIAKVDNEILPLLRDTFGAAFTVKEGETLRATLGDPNKSPMEKDAVLQAFMSQKKAQVQSLKRQVSANPYSGQGNPAITQDYTLLETAPPVGGQAALAKQHLMSKGMTEQQAIQFIQQNGLQ